MAYITKRGSSYGVRYTYQDEQGKNCNKWESFSTKDEATNRTQTCKRNFSDSVHHHRQRVFDGVAPPSSATSTNGHPAPINPIWERSRTSSFRISAICRCRSSSPTIWRTCMPLLAKRPAASILRAKSRCSRKNNSSGFSSGTTIHEVHRPLRTAF